MQRGQFGLASLLSNSSLADSSSLSGLTNVQVFADGVINNPATGSANIFKNGFESVFAQDTNGIIYTRRIELDTWTLLYSLKKPSSERA